MAGRGLFLFLVYVPLLVLAASAAGGAATTRIEALALAIPIGRQWSLFWRSIALALGVAVVGTAAGVLAATVLQPWRSGPRRYLRWLVLAMIPVPPYVHALAWMAVLFRFNSRLTAWDWPALPLTGSLVAGWVELMALLPLAVGLALVALDAVPPELIEAGRIARSDVRVLARVVLPLAGPLILAGTGLLFLLSVLDYSIPSLFQVNVYALAIFADYSATGQVVRALAMALPMVILAVMVVALTQSRWRQAAERPVRPGAALSAPPAWPSWFRLLQGLALVVLMLQMLVPFASLLASVGSWNHFVETVVPARDELAFSLGIAAAAAALCTLPALAVAHRLALRGRHARWWWALASLPLAVPAPLVGIGMILLWNRPSLPPLYNSAAMPVLAGAARFAPLAAIVLAAQLRRIDPLLVDAMRVYQRHPAGGWLRVQLPMLAPGLLAAGGLVFALTLGELGATLLVAPPGRGTLTIRIYNYLHFGASDAVAGLCLVMTAATLAGGILTVTAFAAGSRLLAGGTKT